MSWDHQNEAAARQESVRSAVGGVLRYGDWEIYPTDPVPPIPGWQQFAWSYAHKDYDGPEDSRCGLAPSIEACKAEIDLASDDLPESEAR